MKSARWDIMNNEQDQQETTNNNLRKTLADKKNAYIDSTMTPYGFYDNGINSSQANVAEDNKRLPDKSIHIS